MTIRSVELHVIETEHDEHLADLVGLDLPGADDVCDHCETVIGHRRKRFYRYVIALDEHGCSFYCLQCAGPAVEPYTKD